jgi:hypothetical protein
MTDVPEELRGFILRYVDSVAQLEALLLLHTDPSKGWTTDSLAGRLYITAEQAAPLLQRLKEDGFVESAGEEYRYEAGPADRAAIVNRLAAFYASHIVTVTNLIHSKPRRIREFADAFRLKKD